MNIIVRSENVSNLAIPASNNREDCPKLDMTSSKTGCALLRLRERVGR